MTWPNQNSVSTSVPNPAPELSQIWPLWSHPQPGRKPRWVWTVPEKRNALFDDVIISQLIAAFDRFGQGSSNETWGGYCCSKANPTFSTGATCGCYGRHGRQQQQETWTHSQAAPRRLMSVAEQPATGRDRTGSGRRFWHGARVGLQPAAIWWLQPNQSTFCLRVKLGAWFQPWSALRGACHRRTQARRLISTGRNVFDAHFRRCRVCGAGNSTLLRADNGRPETRCTTAAAAFGQWPAAMGAAKALIFFAVSQQPLSEMLMKTRPAHCRYPRGTSKAQGRPCRFSLKNVPPSWVPEDQHLMFTKILVIANRGGNRLPGSYERRNRDTPWVSAVCCLFRCRRNAPRSLGWPTRLSHGPACQLLNSYFARWHHYWGSRWKAAAQGHSPGYGYSFR